MQPSTYEGRTLEKPRSSRRVTSAKKLQSHYRLGESSQAESDADDSSSSGSKVPKQDKLFGDDHYRLRLGVGYKFQAYIPEWDGSMSDSDSKWLGTKIWPLEKGEKRHFLRGKQEDCGCAIPGSVECVRFHVSEKIARLKLELGSDFNYWRFDYMGEKVACTWTTEEETVFKTVVAEYHNFTELWQKFYEAFPARSKAACVSYYFDVFLLRRRSEQNRNGPDDVDSDIDMDEDSSNPDNKVEEQENGNPASSITRQRSRKTEPDKQIIPNICLTSN